MAGQEYQSLTQQYEDEEPWMAGKPFNKHFYWLLDRRFYQFINQALIDHHSEYRIHAVDYFDLFHSPLQVSSFDEFKIRDDSKASFLLLTKPQADAIRAIKEESRLGPYLPIRQET